MKQIHFNYWTKDDIEALEKAKTFRDLANLALSIIRRMPKGVQMVSGPITTGGLGDVAQNQKVFESIIEILVEKGVNVFSQMPFEKKIAELYKAWRVKNPNGGYCHPILDDFYGVLFSSGEIVALNFIFGFESSIGAMWEYENCPRFGIAIKLLPQELSIKASRP